MRRSNDDLPPEAWPKKVVFPGVKSLRVNLKQFGYEHEPKSDFTITEAFWLDRQTCENPMCYNGGLAIGSIIRAAISDRQAKVKDSKRCRGHEGNSRRRGRDCMHVYTWEGIIEYEGGT